MSLVSLQGDSARKRCHFFLPGCFLSGFCLLHSAQDTRSEGTTVWPGRFVCMEACGYCVLVSRKWAVWFRLMFWTLARAACWIFLIACAFCLFAFCSFFSSLVTYRKKVFSLPTPPSYLLAKGGLQWHCLRRRYQALVKMMHRVLMAQEGMLSFRHYSSLATKGLRFSAVSFTSP